MPKSLHTEDARDKKTLLLVSGKRLDAFSGSGTPDFGRAVMGRREHRGAVGRERSRNHTVLVPGKRQKTLSSGGVPDFRRTVIRRGQHLADLLFENKNRRAIPDAQIHQSEVWRIRQHPVPKQEEELHP